MGNAESRPPGGGASTGTPQRKESQSQSQHFPRTGKSGAGAVATTEHASSPNSKSIHSRRRSTTAASPARHDSSKHSNSNNHNNNHNNNSIINTMGNEASALRASSPSDIDPAATTTTLLGEVEKASPEEHTQPRAIQHTTTAVASDGQQDPVLSPAYNLPPAAIYSRPPRLPLPIEEEDHMPGSPILASQDITSPLDDGDLESGIIPRKSSMLSSTTIDDDEDMENNDAFPPDASRSLQVKIPTRMEWNGPGEKVFVTGTFCNWEKKMKLHKNKDKDKQGFSANILLPPGTHHIKFLVDGEMTTSNELPTTVDWTNILVNYVEIVAPLPPETEDKKQPPAPAEPMPIPGATGTADKPGDAVRPLPYRSADPPSGTDADLESTLADVGPKGERLPSVSAPTPMPDSAQKQKSAQESAEAVANVPRPKYTNKIPQFLLDLDNYSHPDDEDFQRAQRVAGTLPPPPSLPMFLSKSILNGNTPHKDDASVLIMPNHTVLNHLATSSIKSGVLATSGTTRYKRKFLTTIMYKPTSDAG